MVGFGLGRFHALANQAGAMLHQFAVFHTEGGRKMAVNVEFAGDYSAHEHRNHDLRLGFQRAGKIARIAVNIIDHDRLARGRGRELTNGMPPPGGQIRPISRRCSPVSPMSVRPAATADITTSGRRVRLAAGS